MTDKVQGTPKWNIAVKAMDIQFARAPLTFRGKQMVCPRTSESFFGAALARCLSDRAVFDDLMEVSVCTNLGIATLLFKSDLADWHATHIAGKGSPIFKSEQTRIDPKTAGIQRTTILRLDGIRFLFDAINEPEPAIAMR